MESGELKLFMVLLGSKAPLRNVEQHDFFFGIARSLKELVPAMKAFWPEAGNSLHIDGWREVTRVEGYTINIIPKQTAAEPALHHLFFLNLGGYQRNKLEEQHYTLLTIQSDKTQAIRHAKHTVFYKTNTFKGATSHVDEKYGIDVDDIYKIEEILSPTQKAQYHLQFSPADGGVEDEIHLGYLLLHKL